MSYKVNVSATARSEADAYHAFILNRSHDSIPAALWWNGLLDALDTLRELPTRCPNIPEQRHFEFPVYQLLHASHRILFRVDKQTVKVLRIYHSALRPLQSLSQRAQHRNPKKT